LNTSPHFNATLSTLTIYQYVIICNNPIQPIIYQEIPSTTVDSYCSICPKYLPNIPSTLAASQALGAVSTLQIAGTVDGSSEAADFPGRIIMGQSVMVTLQ